MTDTRLAHIDQASFLGLRALGHQPFFQGTWVYERAIDMAALTRFNENLAHTLLGRLVDTSPLPFGRHRWARIDRVPEIVVESAPRDRSELGAWIDEISNRPIDPESGPGWLLGVLTFTDGGTAVTMPIPHTLGDGLCVLQAIGDATQGHSRGPAYPARYAGNRVKRFFADLASSFRSLPSLAKAVVGLVKAARSMSSPGSPGPKALPPSPHPASQHQVVGVLVDQADWDARAAAVGGSSNTLVQAFAASIGERLGRIGSDGQVRLAIPVSVREDGDTRANALDSITVACEPALLATDVSALRAATKTALQRLATTSHAMLAALPLTPLLPKALVRKSEAIAMGAHDVPVGCSNYGPMDPAVGQIDGAEARYFTARLVEPGMVPADFERIGGSAYVLSGRILGRVFLSTNAYQPGVDLTQDQLAKHVDEVLGQFGLSSAQRVI
ncbi:MAG: hypothetical protein GX678_01040 [Actinomycetales bacterium]|nr:hypothetical protein [Actinomycetales bacterium]